MPLGWEGAVGWCIQWLNLTCQVFCVMGSEAYICPIQAEATVGELTKIEAGGVKMKGYDLAF